MHADGGGLYLRVGATGAKSWILRTVVRGKRRDIGLGGVSWVPLAEARDKARHLRAVARRGGDPVLERDGDQMALTFEQAARTVHAEHVAGKGRSGKHQGQWIATLEAYAFPTLGKMFVAEITSGEVLAVLSPIWMEKPETARRVRQRLRTVFDWSIAAGHRSTANPVTGIEKGLPRQRDRVNHFAALPFAELPPFMARLEAADGMGALALRFVILTAARSGEVRGAKWAEIDIEAALWTIPGERMKAGREHRVPLSSQVLALLDHVHPLRSKRDAIVFPSSRGNRPLSDMTLAAVLKRLKAPVTVHGFRSTFRDWAAEHGTPGEIAEAALAHTVGGVEGAYRRTDFLDARRDLMAVWGRFATEHCWGA